MCLTNTIGVTDNVLFFVGFFFKKKDDYLYVQCEFHQANFPIHFVRFYQKPAGVKHTCISYFRACYFLLPYAPCAKSFSPLLVIQPQTHFKQVLTVVADALIGKDVETKRK